MELVFIASHLRVRRSASRYVYASFWRLSRRPSLIPIFASRYVYASFLTHTRRSSRSLAFLQSLRFGHTFESVVKRRPPLVGALSTRSLKTCTSASSPNFSRTLYISLANAPALQPRRDCAFEGTSHTHRLICKANNATYSRVTRARVLNWQWLLLGCGALFVCAQRLNSRYTSENSAVWCF